MAQKKYQKKVNGKIVKFGAQGHRVKVGTKAGDSYCSRSLGIAKKFKQDCSGKDKNTPNCLSRQRWGCVGSKSVKSKAKKFKRAR